MYEFPRQKPNKRFVECTYGNKAVCSMHPRITVALCVQTATLGIVRATVHGGRLSGHVTSHHPASPYHTHVAHPIASPIVVTACDLCGSTPVVAPSGPSRPCPVCEQLPPVWWCPVDPGMSVISNSVEMGLEKSPMMVDGVPPTEPEASSCQAGWRMMGRSKESGSAPAAAYTGHRCFGDGVGACRYQCLRQRDFDSGCGEDGAR